MVRLMTQSLLPGNCCYWRHLGKGGAYGRYVRKIARGLFDASRQRCRKHLAKKIALSAAHLGRVRFIRR